MGRPKKDIDEKTVEAMAKVGATNCEIADHFMCAEATIRSRFHEILTKARATRKVRLRQLQWQLAEKGNLGMLIWLGKQELGQTEKVEQKSEVKAEIVSNYVAQWGSTAERPDNEEGSSSD